MKNIEEMSFKELVKLLSDKLKKEYYSDKDIEGDFKKYLEDFDKEYNTYIKEKVKETPLLLNVFRKLIDEIFELNKFQMKILETQVNIEEKLLKNFNNEEIDLLEQLQKCGNMMTSELVEQAFILGYATATQLRDEAVKKYPKKLSE